MSQPLDLAILIFDDVEVLDFCGPLEVFSVAARIGATPTVNVFTVAESTPVEARNGLSVNVDYLLEYCPKVDILLVPGGSGTRRELSNERLLDWIGQVARGAQLVLSVCTGALLLGKVGLLDGQQVTTHHNAYELLSEIVPSATVHRDRRYLDQGNLVTSAGISAGIDMSLHVVSRLWDDEVAAATAHQMEYAWERQ